MMDFIKRLKAAYTLFNFFHRQSLIHNVPLFKKLGLKKKYFSSLSSRDFRHIPGKALLPAAAADIRDTVLYREADDATRESMLAFDQNGFLVMRHYLSPEQADQINSTIESLLQAKKLSFRYGNKLMFAIRQSPFLRSIGEDKKLQELLDCLMQGEAVLFQSINFLMGSEQRTHSDAIHMTTYPPGGLLGLWIALDDIDAANGPLHYYPGSHRLPYYTNADYNNEGNAFLLGRQSYTAYEDMIQARLAEKGMRRNIFTAAKGDILVWHANLFHGGEPHADKTRTRKSMVLHYFNKNAICYHEITQRPALLKTRHS